MLGIFGLPKFNDTLIIGQILDTQLMEMCLSTSLAGSPGDMSAESFEVELCHEELKAGPLVFTDLDASFKWISAAATGKQSSVVTYLRVVLLDQDVVGKLFYINSPKQRRFSGSLLLKSPTSNASIDLILKACLPSNMPDLKILGSFLDNLILKLDLLILMM